MSWAQSHYLLPRADWLARRPEPALDPELPIIDPHHHIWDRPGWRYLLDDLLADLHPGDATQHNIVATVFVQCRAMHRAGGPEAFRPVGETEFANGIAAMVASGIYGTTKICAGIVSHVDLRLGAEAKPVLEAHIRAGGGRFRGIRHIAAWDADPLFNNPGYAPPPDLFDLPEFRAGMAELAALDLSFEAWLYHPQLPQLIALARACPANRIVLNHVGAPLGIGRFAMTREAVFQDWSALIRELATCPNVCVKLGGLGMRINGFGFETGAEPPTSAALAAAWKPYVATVIEAFGAERCMFESNFPVDKGSYAYGVGWNAFKLLAAGATPAERTALFSGTAARFYKLDI
jgi:predicted TIM-barrel fold metal-dependent hydrolase